MTRQIVIKLNEERFKPILDSLKLDGHGAVSSYSELIGKIVFFDYLLWTEKCKELDNKTRMEFLLEKLDTSKDKLLINFLQKYTKFVKSGVKPAEFSESKGCSMDSS